MNHPEAFLFDLDGVLTDTAQYHFQAWKQLAERLCLAFDLADNERLKGVSRRRSFEIILEKNGCTGFFAEEEMINLIDEKNSRYIALIEQLTTEDILPGILPLLDALDANHIKKAVASASKNADAVLHRLGLTDRFDYIADASKISHPKPHPEVFLDCAEHLFISPKHCVGLEDAQAGIEAIRAAGMFSVGIGVSVTTIRPDLFVSNTSELSYRRICTDYASSQ